MCSFEAWTFFYTVLCFEILEPQALIEEYKQIYNKSEPYQPWKITISK